MCKEPKNILLADDVMDDAQILLRFERFSHAISEISRCWHKLASEEMEKYRLKGSHSVYLLTVARHPEGITSPQICELCGRDKSDVSRMMSIMEQSGLVVKEGGGRTRYGGMYRLTDEGKRAAAYVGQRAGLAVELAGHALSKADRAVFYSALDSITQNLRILSEEGLPRA